MNRIVLIDRLSGKRVFEFYRQYVLTQWYDRERLDAFRLVKLRRLLAHCERHVPYYRDAMKAAGLCADQVDGLDALEALPVIDKALVKGEHVRFRSTLVGDRRKIRYSHTGGTTGEPLKVPKDVDMRSSSQAAVFRYWDWMGIRPGDPNLLLWGAPVLTPSWRKRLRDGVLNAIMNSHQINAFGLNRDDVAELSVLFRRVRPVLVHGYCQTIYELARWFEAAGETFSVRAVSTTVEPLFPEYRPVMRRAFGGETFDQYGCGEVESIAMECGSHQGLHVIEERVVLELDREGNVIVTDLDNLAFPFIRYKNGDQAAFNSRPCSCGRVHQLLDRILGRVGDVVVGPSGRRVHPEFFTHLVNETGVAFQRRLRKYQVVQEGTTRLTWKIVADKLDDFDRGRLVAGVKHHLGPVEVVIEEVDDIPPAPSGKFQYVIVRR